MIVPGDLLIRADASREIGSGHLMRCVALAHAWRQAGGTVLFLTARPSGGTLETLRDNGFAIRELERAHPDPYDLDVVSAEVSRRRRSTVVLDGYHFDERYQRAMKALDCRLGVIDDLAQLPHYRADVIVNQNLGAQARRYHAGPETVTLLGPRYALLRPEFLPLRTWGRSTPDRARNVLVTFGGSDVKRATLRAVEALVSFSAAALHIRVIAGAFNPVTDDLRALATRTTGVDVLTDVRNMPEQMQWADLAVCAGGGTAWELAFMGVPMIVMSTADNQEPGASAIAEAGMGAYLGRVEDVTDAALADALSVAISSGEGRRRMSEIGRACVDGLGAGRVVRALIQENVSVRRAADTDCRVLFEWANDPAVRAQSFSSDPIPWASHVAWFEASLRNPQSVLFIGHDMDGAPIGQVRFDIDAGRATISVSLSPASRGRGLGTMLIKRAGEAIESMTHLEVIDAYVKPDNLASVRAFEKAGYTLAGTSEVRGQHALHFTWTRV